MQAASTTVCGPKRSAEIAYPVHKPARVHFGDRCQAHQFLCSVRPQLIKAHMRTTTSSNTVRREELEAGEVKDGTYDVLDLVVLEFIAVRNTVETFPAVFFDLSCRWRKE